MPARERRTALAIARSASSWPTTRRRNSSSRFASFLVSLSSILVTGMPVQRETTAAMSCSVTSSLSIRLSFWTLASFLAAALLRFSSSGIRPYLISATFSSSASRSALSASIFSCSIWCWQAWISLMSFFSFCQWISIWLLCSRRSASCRSRLRSRFLAAASDSFFSASRSISSWVIFRFRLSSSSGIESISIRRAEVASSIRSIALSGRKRSVM